MGKKKKTTEKLLAFYRGPIIKAPRLADDDELKLIFEALEDCCQLDRRNNSYEFPWNNSKPISLKLVLGFKSGLRCLKQGRTLALICDDKLTPHAIKFLIDSANKQSLPFIQTNGLSKIAPKLGIKTSLSLVSIVKEVTGDEQVYQNPKNPKPAPSGQRLVSEPLNKLCKLLLTLIDKTLSTTVFRLPNQERVPASGLSKAKKETKKVLKSAKLQVKDKQKHVCAAAES